MADDTVKEALDGVVKAIGFGIVSDFRQLSDAMLDVSADLRDANRLLDQVNQNTSQTNKTLDDFDKTTTRQREFRRNRKAEDKLERRAQLNAQRGEAAMEKIANAIESLQRQVSMGAAGGDDNDGGEDNGGGFLENIGKTVGSFLAVGGLAAAGALGAEMFGAGEASAEEASSAELAPPPDTSAPVPTPTQPGGYSVPPSSAGAAPQAAPPPPPSSQSAPPPPPNKTKAAASFSFISSAEAAEPESAPDISPSAAAAPAPPPPTTANDLLRLGTTNQVGSAITAGATKLAAQAIVERSSKSATQKALAKVSSKIPSWMAKNGATIVNIIGSKSVPIFGALVGGYFSFNRFMAGDSWMSIGAEFVSGIAPDVGALGGPAGYVAGVVSTLAIQTYLITRDIYQEENAIDIRNNVVPNFDDLDMSEKAQVLNVVKNHVMTYVNSLISKSSAQDASVGVKAPSTSGGIIPPTTSGAQLPPDTPSTSEQPPGQQQTPTSPAGGVTTGVAHDIADQREQSQADGGPAAAWGSPVPQTPEEQSQFNQDVYGGGVSSPDLQPGPSGSTSSEQSEDQSTNTQVGGSPSDNIASVQTSSDQAGSITGGSMEELKAEIARGEGDYGAYNRGTAGDTPRSKRTVDIQNLTVGQIMQYQSQGKLFAVGKYQFIPETFAEAVRATGVSPDQKFDASTQEAMFPYLVSEAKRPKLAGYLSGKHDNANAALNDLAAEFASIPQSNGVGRYDGDRAGNKAAGGLKRAQKIKQILKGIRESNTGSKSRENDATTEQGTQTAEVTNKFAKGATITPLSSDSPKPGRNIGAELAPISAPSDPMSDEEKVTSSQQTIDARKKSTPSGSPKEKEKNMISSYSSYMQYLFGTMSEELMTHMRGEVTAEKNFRDAMNPLS